jgi:hypothetical protein
MRKYGLIVVFSGVFAGLTLYTAVTSNWMLATIVALAGVFTTSLMVAFRLHRRDQLQARIRQHRQKSIKLQPVEVELEETKVLVEKLHGELRDAVDSADRLRSDPDQVYVLREALVEIGKLSGADANAKPFQIVSAVGAMVATKTAATLPDPRTSAAEDNVNLLEALVYDLIAVLELPAGTDVTNAVERAIEMVETHQSELEAAAQPVSLADSEAERKLALILRELGALFEQHKEPPTDNPGVIAELLAKSLVLSRTQMVWVRILREALGLDKDTFQSIRDPLSVLVTDYDERLAVVEQAKATELRQLHEEMNQRLKDRDQDFDMLQTSLQEMAEVLAKTQMDLYAMTKERNELFAENHRLLTEFSGEQIDDELSAVSEEYSPGPEEVKPPGSDAEPQLDSGVAEKLFGNDEISSALDGLTEDEAPSPFDRSDSQSSVLAEDSTKEMVDKEKEDSQYTSWAKEVPDKASEDEDELVDLGEYRQNRQAVNGVQGPDSGSSE